MDMENIFLNIDIMKVIGLKIKCMEKVICNMHQVMESIKANFKMIKSMDMVYTLMIPVVNMQVKLLENINKIL